MMHWRGMLMHEIMEKIPDDQKKVILKRIIDGKILLRENLFFPLGTNRFLCSRPSDGKANPCQVW